MHRLSNCLYVVRMVMFMFRIVVMARSFSASPFVHHYHVLLFSSNVINDVVRIRNNFRTSIHSMSMFIIRSKLSDDTVILIRLISVSICLSDYLSLCFLLSVPCASQSTPLFSYPLSMLYSLSISLSFALCVSLLFSPSPYTWRARHEQRTRLISTTHAGPPWPARGPTVGRVRGRA